MTSSSEPSAPASTGPTTTLPSVVGARAARADYDRRSATTRATSGVSWPGTPTGARQAQAERAADLASHKASWAATQARAGKLLGRLGSRHPGVHGPFGGAEAPGLTEQLIGAAFELAEAVVGGELRTRPDLATRSGPQGPGEPPGRGRRWYASTPTTSRILREAAASLSGNRPDRA